MTAIRCEKFLFNMCRPLR